MVGGISLVFEEFGEKSEVFCVVFLVLLEFGSSGFVSSKFAVSKACAKMDSRFVRFLGLILKDAGVFLFEAILPWKAGILRIQLTQNLKCQCKVGF